jgi:prophage regulatory protein
MNNHTEKGDRFLRMPEVKITSGLSRAHIYLLMSKNQFPKQYKLGDRASGWLESEVRSWMNAKIMASKGSKEAAA